MPSSLNFDEQRSNFIRAIAGYLVEHDAAKGIALEVERAFPGHVQWAAEWQKVRAKSPIFGHVTLDEAEKQLRAFLLDK